MSAPATRRLFYLTVAFLVAALSAMTFGSLPAPAADVFVATIIPLSGAYLTDAAHNLEKTSDVVTPRGHHTTVTLAPRSLTTLVQAVSRSGGLR
jgi:hypothetical protein